MKIIKKGWNRLKRKNVLFFITLVIFVAWSLISGFIIYQQKQYTSWLYQTKWDSINSLSQTIETYDKQLNYYEKQLEILESKGIVTLTRSE